MDEWGKQYARWVPPKAPKLDVRDITFSTQNGARWTEAAKRRAAADACGRHSSWKGGPAPANVRMLLGVPIKCGFLTHDVQVQCEAGGKRWEFTLRGFTEDV
ncbi:MAG: hypothetical protein MPI93_06585 [Nitrosopumilus sp.]|nr:hypothetical protein [Nitrosopumilus sp.]